MIHDKDSNIDETASAFDDPDNHHDDRASEPIAIDDKSRHVLIVEEGRMAYVAPHLPSNHPISECERVGTAWIAFRGPRVKGEYSPLPVPAGRYWISVADDGNLEIGSRIVDELTPAVSE